MVVNLKISELRKRGYKDVSEWLKNPSHLYAARRMRIFIHTKIKTDEPIGTKVSKNDKGEKVLLRPTKNNNKQFDKNLLKQPIGSYVNKKSETVKLFIIPKSKWHNPIKVKKTEKNETKETLYKKATNQFEDYLKQNKKLLSDLNELDGIKEIGCWCKPLDCHCDVIVKHYKKYKQSE